MGEAGAQLEGAFARFPLPTLPNVGGGELRLELMRSLLYVPPRTTGASPMPPIVGLTLDTAGPTGIGKVGRYLIREN